MNRLVPRVLAIKAVAIIVLLRIPVDRDRAFRFNVTEDSEFA
jgi:hypothetical protein